MKIRKNISLILLIIFPVLLLTLISCSKEDNDPKIKTLDEYKLEFSNLVSTEKAKVQNCVVGYNKGDFRNESLFAEATFNYLQDLLMAEVVLAKSDLKIMDIVEVNQSITENGKAFNDNLYNSDRRPIHERIVFCDTLLAHTPEGFERGMCPPEPRNAFKAEISAAKSVRSFTATIDRQVSEAVIKLNTALDIFNEAIIK